MLLGKHAREVGKPVVQHSRIKCLPKLEEAWEIEVGMTWRKERCHNGHHGQDGLGVSVSTLKVTRKRETDILGYEG
jgi:hypothetical protein